MAANAIHAPWIRVIDKLFAAQYTADGRLAPRMFSGWLGGPLVSYIGSATCRPKGSGVGAGGAPFAHVAASLGAAMLTAAGTGRFSSITEASEAWYRPARIFAPDSTRYEIYREVYTRYLDLMRRIYGEAPFRPPGAGSPS